MSVNLEVNLGGLVMKNPLTVASGTFGAGREYAKIWGAIPLNTLGALTTKGVSWDAWPGNAGVRITEAAGGMLNSVGLQNPGVKEFCSQNAAWLGSLAMPVIVNVSGHRTEEYARVVEYLEQAEVADAYEINISCPNVDCGGMGFGTDARIAAQVTSSCREKTRKPLVVKLTPNVTDITEIALAVEDAGADALSLINTVAGMAIDSKTRSRVFERGMGGLSGPAIKPVALYAVYRVYQAVGIPLLGMGGIQSVEDALEFLLAGATAVAVGTATFGDPLRAVSLIAEMESWCLSEGVRNISELTGALR